MFKIFKNPEKLKKAGTVILLLAAAWLVAYIVTKIVVTLKDKQSGSDSNDGSSAADTGATARLRKGSQGDDVKTLQQAISFIQASAYMPIADTLPVDGRRFTVDGYWGDSTEIGVACLYNISAKKYAGAAEIQPFHDLIHWNTKSGYSVDPANLNAILTAARYSYSSLYYPERNGKTFSTVSGVWH